jgi:hypothetical protein
MILSCFILISFVYISAGDQIKKEMGVACDTYWVWREDGKHERKRPSEVPRRILEDNIKEGHK